MKRALVTGGAVRLGRAMALYLAGRGFDVAISYNGSDDAAVDTVADIRAQGVRGAALQADLLRDDAVAGLIGRAAEALDGPLTVLINNASIFTYDTIDTATPDDWDRHIGSNLKAPLFLSQAFARQAPAAMMDEQGEPRAIAAIINMVDQRVLKPTPHFMTYTVAKMGLWALTRTLAQALAPDIRVNAIGPGPTLRGTRQSEDHFATQRHGTVLGRGSNPADICAAVGYLVDSPAVTGQLICVDGGQHLGWRTPDIVGIG